MNDDYPNPGGRPSGFEETLDGIDIRQLVNSVFERLWLVTLCFAAFLLLGVAYIVISPKLYEATAEVEVAQQDQKIVKMDEVQGGSYESLEVLKTIEQNLQRVSLFKRVMARPEIKEDKHLLDGYAGSYEDYQPAELANMLGDWTTVGLQRGTRLIGVTVEHRDAATAQKLANAIVGEYMLEKVEMKSGTSADAFQFLIGEAERVREKLQKAEDNLQDFAQAVEIKKKVEQQERLIDGLSQRYKEKHPTMVQAQGLLENLHEQFRQELLKVRKRYGDDAKFWGGQDALDNLKSLTGEERVNEELKLIEARFNVLTRELETDRVLYDSLVTRMKETDVTKDMNASAIQIVEKAQLPLEPSKPKKLLILALSVFLGLACGLGLVIVLNLLDNTLKTVDEAERRVGAPVLAAVPDDGRIPDVDWMKQEGGRVLHQLEAKLKEQLAAGETPTGVIRKNKASRGKGGRKGGKIEPLVMLSDPGGRTAEAIRSLRASLKLLGREEDRRVFLVTSAVPGEGKSFISSNLAFAFSQEGKKTLLIDADLRRPVVQNIFNIKKPEQGVVPYLTSTTTVEEQVIHTPFECLDLMLVGPQAPNPAELLAAGGFVQLLEEATKLYDRIIVDSAPVNAVADTLMIAPLVQTVCLTGRAASTPKGAIIRAMNALTKAGAKPAGLVLNRLPSRSGLAGDPYYYYYSAGEGYGQNYGKSYS